MSDKDSFTGTIVGTVEKMGTYGKGLYARIAYKTNPNSQYPERATAWGVDGGLTEGDRVKVSGAISVRKTERDGKTYIDVSVNFPSVTHLDPVQAAPQPVVDADVWATPGSLNDETPF